ncbi:MAG: nucleotidyltransferase domain-containing protein [Clostridiales bacterium]
MRKNWLETDRVVPKICKILEECAKQYEIDIKSIILYGSKARGEIRSSNDYEIVLLVDDEIDTGNYIKLVNTIRIEFLKEKLINVNLLIYTPEVFEEILYKDENVGTFLYMICKENTIIYDKKGTFTAIRKRMSSNNIKNEEIFINQCIIFAKKLGSAKWEQKWEKVLMQHRYLKRRNNY